MVALMNCSSRVNVYGWDQYVNIKFPKTLNRQIRLLWPMKSFSFFSTCIINWIYAYRILNENSDCVKIEGRIKEVKDIKWIPEKAFQVIYKK